jgi:hypothetical protein
MGVGQDGEGSDEVEEHRWGLERLSLGFGFGQNKAWAGCDELWAIIFVLAFRGISFIPPEA